VLKFTSGGPASTTLGLDARLQKYLSPPLFPVSVRELAASFHFHELPDDVIDIGEFRIQTQLIIHPNPTIGYRIQSSNTTLTYVPDHEPALGGRSFGNDKSWTSGYKLAEGADLLIHDTQYTEEEYQDRIGFGHSSISHAFRFAQLSNVKHFAPFHHDPTHNDDTLDGMFERTIGNMQPPYKVTPSREGLVIEVTG
jgi:ribonuclease BN (tRNA processing enzyme)